MRKLLILVVCHAFLLLTATAQEKSISGKVTEENGTPIGNASVMVKGTTRGTVTKSDGTYTLSIPANAKTLVISSVGMGSMEVSIGNKTTIDATLNREDKTLQEAVVVAYGQQKKTELTGSVSQVKAAQIENKPFTSIDKALQGMVAGLQSVASSGAPGANQQIRIRGISSISASNAPLWVIDGLPVNANDLSRQTTTANILSTLNPNDIESISVLKDAASASIYGSRAANGVILITTKKGKAGKTKIRFDVETGRSDVAYQGDGYKPLHSAEYIALITEGLVNAGASQATINATLAARGANNTGVSTDWLDAVLRKGTQTQYNLSASGGNDKTTFYLSGGYFKQEGTTIATDLDRYTGAIRVTNKITDKISVSTNIDGGFVRQHTPLTGGAFGNPVLSSFFVLPTKPIYNPDGTFNVVSADFPTSSLYNTVALAHMDKRYLKELSMRGSSSVDYTIIKNLKLKTAFGGDLSVLEEDQYNNPLYGDGAVLAAGSPTFNPGVNYNPTTTGRAIALYTRYFNWVWTNTLSYHGDILRSGNLSYNILGGYENQRSRSYFTTLQSRGFSLSPTLYLQYPSSGATPTTTTGAISDYTFSSEFTIADVNYKNKYIVSGSFRRDGSSKFGPKNKYGNFWSVGGSWNVDRENFMQNVRFIDQLKLRGSYGVNGNAGIGNYDYFPTYAFGSSYNSAPASTPGNVGNLDLTWELNKPLNIGIDVSIFKNRLGLTFDWYKRISSDLLLAVPLSRTSGFTSQTRNIGKMENKGIELTVNATPVQTKDFNWTVNLIYAHNKNKVLSLPDHNPIIGTFIIKEGLDIQTFYVRVYKGVNPANGDPLWYYDSTRTKDTNNIGVAQRVPYGSASPKYFGAFTNTFKFKGFSLELQFNYQFGNLVQDSWGSYYLGAGFNAGFNKMARILNRWQKPGDITDIPKFIENGNKNFQNFSTFYLIKGDFIRLRNVQFGYEVPKSVLSKLKIDRAFFYVRGTNIWTWVKDKHLGFDPEQGVSSQTNLDVFIPKTVTVGVNLGF